MPQQANGSSGEDPASEHHDYTSQPALRRSHGLKANSRPSSGAQLSKPQVLVNGVSLESQEDAILARLGAIHGKACDPAHRFIE
jgi:hypothetical protein